MKKQYIGHVLDVVTFQSLFGSKAVALKPEDCLPIFFNCLSVSASIRMADLNNGGAGYTDPLLAKQKQHSKKAFELIGKALGLDEKNKEGRYTPIGTPV